MEKTMSITDMSRAVLKEIFSHTGLSALPKTCKAMHDSYSPIVSEQGVDLARSLPSSLWSANTYQRTDEKSRFQHVVYPLPLPSEPITHEQGLEIIKTAFDTAQYAWRQFSNVDKERFKGYTPQQCCVNPRHMTEILRILDEISLIEILKFYGVTPEKTREEQLQQLNTQKQLRLGFQSLQVLPEAIGLLTRIQELHLHTNQLTSIPESISLLKHLQKLTLDHNQLRLLPKSIGLLKQLQVLTLDVNQLTSLPESLTTLPHLRFINVCGNKKLRNEEDARILLTLKKHGCSVLCDREMREAIQNVSISVT